MVVELPTKIPAGSETLFIFNFQRSDGTTVTTTGGTTPRVFFKKPDGTVLTKTGVEGVALGPGTTQTQYLALITDLPEADIGQWEAWAEITLSSKTYPSLKKNFSVESVA